jgi:hypothetical protein
VLAARVDDSLGLNKSHKTGVTALKVRQIKEVLDELNSSDFDDE